MANLLTRKLKAFAPLPEADKRLLEWALNRVRFESDGSCGLGSAGSVPI